MTSPSIRVVRASDPVAEAGRRLAAAIDETVTSRGSARVAVSGGSALAAWRPAAEALGDTLAQVRLTLVDERCVPAEAADSNFGALLRSGAPMPPEVHALWDDAEDVSRNLTRARAFLADRFEGALDVTLLGMGPDGHVASLFPGHAAVGELVAHVSDSPKPPPCRVTLTRALLGTAGAHVLLATGEPKRKAAERLLAGDPALPLVGIPHVTLVTDLDLHQGSPA